MSEVDTKQTISLCLKLQPYSRKEMCVLCYYNFECFYVISVHREIHSAIWLTFSVVKGFKDCLVNGKISRNMLILLLLSHCSH